MSRGWSLTWCVGLALLLSCIPAEGDDPSGASDTQRLARRYIETGATADFDRALAAIGNSPDFAALRDTVKRALIPAHGKPGTRTIQLPAPEGQRSLGRYALHVPDTYDGSRAHPLILGLAGGAGDGEKFLPRLARLVADSDCIVACPVAGGTMWWHTAYVIALATLEDVKRRYHVDTNRVYLYGVSNGGNGAWFMGIHYPHLFAAVGSVAGCPATGPGRIDYPYLANLLNLPVHFVHGEKDPNISIKPERKASEILRELEYSFVFKEIPGGGHAVPLGDRKRIIEWLADKRRAPNPAKVRYRKRSSEPRTCYWLHLSKTRRGSYVEAEVRRRREIHIRCANVKQLALYLSHDLVDLDVPIEVNVNGEKQFSRQCVRRPGILLKTARAFRDAGRLYSVAVAVNVPSR